MLLHESKVNSLKMNGKMEALFNETNTIKRDQTEILEQKIMISYMEMFTFPVA